MSKIFVHPDNSTSAITGLGDIVLNQGLDLQIPNINPAQIENIIQRLNQKGIY